MNERSPHFLHAKMALEPVLAVPIPAPRALKWCAGREVLLVASADGTVSSVEPSFGSRALFVAAPDPVQITTSGDRVGLLSADGAVDIWCLGESTPSQQFQSGLSGDSGLRFCAECIAVIGDSPAGRRVRLFAEGACVRDVAVQEGTALGVTDDGDLRLARSLQSGIHVGALGTPLPEGEATGHQLRFTPGGHVMGVAVGGATLWSGGPPLSVRLLDSSCAALAPDGHTVALGTQTGLVALSDMRGPPALRGHPARISAHEAPVRCISFATRGRWLATVAEICRLWAY